MRDEDSIDDNGWRDGGDENLQTAATAGRRRRWKLVVAESVEGVFAQRNLRR